MSVPVAFPGVGELPVRPGVDDGCVPGCVGEVHLVVYRFAPVECEGGPEDLLNRGALLEDVGDHPLPWVPSLRMGVQRLGGYPVAVEAQALLVDSRHLDHGPVAPGGPDVDHAEPPTGVHDQVCVVGSLILVPSEEDCLLLGRREDGAGGRRLDRQGEHVQHYQTQC